MTQNDDSARNLVHKVRGKTINILYGLKDGSIKNDQITFRLLQQAYGILDAITIPQKLNAKLEEKEPESDDAACFQLSTCCNCSP